uniref:clp protease proteolytic subunit n=1 Tax=Dasymalla teckiana TaxID=2835933 RepID=UPI001D02114F|nr:clp protease proteolytic subunit [Dasymalla teckiana]QVL24621.1 clp protease proteolytic subunit [Dasymalla teckiana]
MPIGVPRVPFLIPGEEEACWVDIYNRLYRQRFLFLGQEVDSIISNQLIGLMVFLSIEDCTKDQYLYINSPGGSIVSGFGIYDTMQAVGPDFHTVAVGLAASMASVLLAGGHFTKRLAYPHAAIMIHQPAVWYFIDQADECDLDMEILEDLRDMVVDVYAQRTGKARSVIDEDIERDFYMSANEALAYGIIDSVVVE